jgi:hypothetical protein
MSPFSENKTSVYNIMEDEKMQKQQYNKILSVYNGGKYEEHIYMNESKILVLKNNNPVRKRCFACDWKTYVAVLKFL